MLNNNIVKKFIVSKYPECNGILDHEIISEITDDVQKFYIDNMEVLIFWIESNVILILTHNLKKIYSFENNYYINEWIPKLEFSTFERNYKLSKIMKK